MRPARPSANVGQCRESPVREAAPPPVFAAAALGLLTLRNRVVKSATYEGLSHRGRVTRDLVDFHRSLCRGRRRE